MGFFRSFPSMLISYAHDRASAAVNWVQERSSGCLKEQTFKKDNNDQYWSIKQEYSP
jgi:hypothetical protein